MFCQYLLEHRGPLSWLVLWIPFRVCWRSVAAVTSHFVFVESEGEWQLSAIRPRTWNSGILPIQCLFSKLRQSYAPFWQEVITVIVALLCCEVAQSCPTLCDPMDCSLPDSSLHRILQARVLEWVAISFSRGSSQPRNQTRVSCILGRRFNLWATNRCLVP